MVILAKSAYIIYNAADLKKIQEEELYLGK